MTGDSESGTPLVPVVIPTFNHAHFIARAVKSVVSQTYPQWEAIVIDNHSRDNTDEIVAGVGDARIRVLKIHNNGAIAASRNPGLRHARGEWITFPDSDDCWYPTRLGTLLRLARNGLYDVLSNDELLVDSETGETRVLRYGPYRRNFYKTMLIQGNRLSPSETMVLRRRAAARFRSK